MLKRIERPRLDIVKRLEASLPQGVHSAYALLPLLDEAAANGVWVQIIRGEVTALVVRPVQGCVRLVAAQTADCEELRLFLRQLGGTVECAPALFQKLGGKSLARRSILTLDRLPEDTSGVAISVYEHFEPIYALLRANADADLGGTPTSDADTAYRHWLSATARGVFGGRTVVKAIYDRSGAPCSVAIADIFGRYVYLRDVATRKADRGKGYGSACVRGLCRELQTAENEIFLLCAGDSAQRFYEKSGFTKKTETELGTVE